MAMWGRPLNGRARLGELDVLENVAKPIPSFSPSPNPQGNWPFWVTSNPKRKFWLLLTLSVTLVSTQEPSRFLPWDPLRR